jgi:amino acid adenylation domain-containing protein
VKHTSAPPRTISATKDWSLFSGDQMDIPGWSIPERLAWWAHNRPQLPAIAFGDEQLTYAQLYARATALAHMLLKHHLMDSTTLIAVMLPVGINRIVAMLAGLLLGGYLPLDPTYPAQRRTFLLNTAGIKTIITDEATAESMHDFSQADVLLLDQIDCERQALSSPQDALFAPPSFPSRHVPEDLAILIGTSGTTGMPKIIELTHGGWTNFLHWHHRYFETGVGQRGMQFASPGFDACSWEVWSLLTAGATVYPAPDEVRTNAVLLRDWLIANDIHWAFLTTQLAAVMMQLPWPEEIALRHLVFGGERLTVYPPSGLPFSIYNAYGPTENTVVTSCGRVHALPPGTVWTPPTIGQTIDNVVTCLIGEDGAITPIGESGELCIAGPGLARRYRNNPAETSARFTTITLTDGSLLDVYRTGDRCSMVPGGTINFHGRMAADEVKMNGVRMSFAEIEQQILSLTTENDARPAFDQVMVLARHRELSSPLLVAFVHPRNAEVATSWSPEQVQEALRQTLPIVPAEILIVSEIPVTAHGKVDGEALWARFDVGQTGKLAPLGEQPHSLLEQVLRNVMAEILDAPEGRLSNMQPLPEQGASSLHLTLLQGIIYEATGIRLHMGHSVSIAQVAVELEEQTQEDADNPDLSQVVLAHFTRLKTATGPLREEEQVL